MCLLIYLYLSGTKITIESGLAFPIIAGVALGVGILTFAYAMSHADMETGPTAAIATSNAVFTAMLALAFVFLKEDLDIKQWVGIGTVILGIVLIRI